MYWITLYMYWVYVLDNTLICTGYMYCITVTEFKGSSPQGYMTPLEVPIMIHSCIKLRLWFSALKPGLLVRASEFRPHSIAS